VLAKRRSRGAPFSQGTQVGIERFRGLKVRRMANIIEHNGPTLRHQTGDLMTDRLGVKYATPAVDCEGRDFVRAGRGHQIA
jgi:hypothetical protein